MNKQLIHSERLKESYYKIDHDTGLTIYVYPKKDYSSTYAIFGTKYGSLNNSLVSDSGDIIKIPDGIAHFLEHKLFENEDLDAFEKFSKTGANANAFTSFDKTCYLFSCTDNFDESLKILLEFVQAPYFTKETVQKEIGIIGQEIKMYDDTPSWKVLFNLLEIMYYNSPVKTDIAGTVESISEITPELLYACYNNYYNLSNMVLVVVGNADVDNVLKIADENLKKTEPKKTKFELPYEPAEIVKDYIEEQSAVSIPIMMMGYKEDIGTRQITEKENAATDIILSMLFSQASALYNDLMEKKLINSSFSSESFDGPGFSAVLIEAETKHPHELADRIKKEIDNIHKNGFDQKSFETAKKALYGSFTASFNSTEYIANAIVTDHFSNRNIFDYADALAEITINDVMKRFKQIFNNKCCALSVINPYEVV